MQIIWTNHTVMVDVAGTPPCEVAGFYTFRPLRVKVVIYRDDSVVATAEGHRVKRDGTDALLDSEVPYHPGGTYPYYREPIPDYINQAVELARQCLAQGVAE